MYQIRTDLALETQEKMQEDHVELKGVRFLEEKLSPNLTVSTVVIETENGAKTMGKPKGTYITIEAAQGLPQRGIRTACAGNQTACAVTKGEPLGADCRTWES